MQAQAYRSHQSIHCSTFIVTDATQHPRVPRRRSATPTRYTTLTNQGRHTREQTELKAILLVCSSCNLGPMSKRLYLHASMSVMCPCTTTQASEQGHATSEQHIRKCRSGESTSALSFSTVHTVLCFDGKDAMPEQFGSHTFGILLMMLSKAYSGGSSLILWKLFMSNYYLCQQCLLILDTGIPYSAAKNYHRSLIVLTIMYQCSWQCWNGQDNNARTPGNAEQQNAHLAICRSHRHECRKETLHGSILEETCKQIQFRHLPISMCTTAELRRDTMLQSCINFLQAPRAPRR